MNLKELAEALGLSQTTVSRALDGYPEVAEATRRRVLEAAERFNYRPNSRAKALATGRAMAIGHVIPKSKSSVMVNPIFAEFLAGASETYTGVGYDIVLSLVEDGDEERAYRDMAAKRMVDGVVVFMTMVNDPRIPLLKELGLPFVVHGRATGMTDAYSWVDVNNMRSFRRATEFLVDLGHSRIALVNGPESYAFAVRRRDGYLAGLQSRGLEPDPSIMLQEEMTEQYGFRAMTELLSRPDPPTAYLSASMITTLGMRRATDSAGLRLGRDISLITYDDDLSYFQNGQDELIFTAIRSSVREAGRSAARTVVGLIANAEESEQLLLPADLILGQSTGPAPRAAVPAQAALPGE